MTPNGTYTIVATGKSSGAQATTTLTVNAAHATLTLTPDSIPAGFLTKATLSGFRPGEVICLDFAPCGGSAPVTADASGNATVSLHPPADLIPSSPDAYIVTATGTTTVRYASAPVTLTSSSAAITANPTSVAPGSTLTLTASGFLPLESVRFPNVATSPQAAPTATADTSGTATLRLDFLGGFFAAPGPNSLVAEGVTSGLSAPGPGKPASNVTFNPCSAGLSVTPSGLTLAGAAAPVTVTGLGFMPGETVNVFGPQFAGLETVSSGGTFADTFTVPANAGTAQLVSYNINAVGLKTACRAQTLLSLSNSTPPPALTVSPVSATAGLTTLTISSSGSVFSPTESVVIGIQSLGQGPLTVTADSSGNLPATTVQLTEPLAPGGVYDLSAQGSSSGHAATFALPVTAAPPTMTASPSSVTTGSQFTLTATNFGAGDQVTFSGVGIPATTDATRQADSSGTAIFPTTLGSGVTGWPHSGTYTIFALNQYAGQSPPNPLARISTVLLTETRPAATLTLGASGNQTSVHWGDALPVNHSWPNAVLLDPLNAGGLPVIKEEHLFQRDQSAWFKFKVLPSAKVIVELKNLPANYTLALYKDIGAAFSTLTSPQDLKALTRLGAEFTPDAYSPDAYSPDAYSPDAYSPDAYSPDAYSADPTGNFLSKDPANVVLPNAVVSPEVVLPSAYMSAQSRSLLAVSAFGGTSGQGIHKQVWEPTVPRAPNDTTADLYYVRVRGRNGAFSLAKPFHLEVTELTGTCAKVSPITTLSDLQIAPGSHKTVFLSDFSPSGLPGSAADQKALQDKLTTIAGRPEVNGLVLHADQDARVRDARSQANQHLDCPYAKNLLALAMKDLIDRARQANPDIQSVVLIGSDAVVPYFRYPDQAGLGQESSYEPPVLDLSASQASLKLGYVLGQDRYGSNIEFSRSDHTFNVPDKPVGRLVETAAEASVMIDAYLSTVASPTPGVVPTPTSALVTGYDFLATAADEIQGQLTAGLGAGGTVDSLISRPQRPGATPPWTADDLKAKLLGKRHDLIFLNAHFTQATALAADYSTRLLSTDLLESEGTAGQAAEVHLDGLQAVLSLQHHNLRHQHAKRQQHARPRRSAGYLACGRRSQFRQPDAEFLGECRW